MRKRFEQQLKIGIIPIEEVVISHKNTHALPCLLKALQQVYLDSKFNRQVFDILERHLQKGKKPTGRKGMDLWELFVLSQVRMCLNASYDEVFDLANNHKTLRSILGVEPSDFTVGKQYGYQNIWDNLNLLNDKILREINEVILEMGHGVFKKKEGAALHTKADTFVVESNVHFPTDYNLLWDSGRKCLDCLNYFIKKHQNIKGWRKLLNWKKELKNKMRSMGKISSGGGKNKEQRLEEEAKGYLQKAKALERKVKNSLKMLPLEDENDLIKILELEYFIDMLNKHIGLLDRRVLKKESIPQEEKLYSLFETYTEWIKKGKHRPPVELGKKILVCTDQYNLIIDYQVLNHQADQEALLPLVERLTAKYNIASLSLDKGFWNPENKELVKMAIPKLVMSKRGKRNMEETLEEREREFKTLKNKHSAIESNINELEHRGLDRCPDKSFPHFTRYIGSGVCAYNLRKIGKEMVRQEKEKIKKAMHKKAA